MSEQGWRDFLHAEGVDDWVVLHGGPTAVFGVDSLLAAAQLAEAIAAVPGLEERTVMSVARDHLTVRLTRGENCMPSMTTWCSAAPAAIGIQHNATARRCLNFT
jgi:4a-hydroxytetrahydrobiopterin dehydratase